MSSDYAIVVPSLGRPGNMSKMLAMFPKAIITVNESGIEPYKDVVPKKQLVPHPDLKLIETRNWIFDNIDADCIIQFNDDIDKLVAVGVRSKTFRNPKIIGGVVQNTYQCAKDLDIGLFGWSLIANNSMLHTTVRPFRAAAPCSAHAFGVRGAARERRFDPTFRGCGDFDFTLETLRLDRKILCDVRWHFSCGGMSRGKGGETGALKTSERDDAQKAIREKWGKHVGKSATAQAIKRNTWRSFSVNVQRLNAMAIK